jgi:hypothetical protein
MSWRNICPGEWNWGRKIEAEPQGLGACQLAWMNEPIGVGVGIEGPT